MFCRRWKGWGRTLKHKSSEGISPSAYSGPVLAIHLLAAALPPATDRCLVPGNGCTALHWALYECIVLHTDALACSFYFFHFGCSCRYCYCSEGAFFKIIHRLMTKHMAPKTNPLKDGDKLKDVSKHKNILTNTTPQKHAHHQSVCAWYAVLTCLPVRAGVCSWLSKHTRLRKRSGRPPRQRRVAAMAMTRARIGQRLHRPLQALPPVEPLWLACLASR